MGLQSKRALRSIFGTIKDKASLSKAAFLSAPGPTSPSSPSSPSSPELVVLRATTHNPSTDPPNPKHIDSFLSFGHGSRLAASSAVAALTSRLRSTRDSAVALKCLLTVHHVINRGPFILQDQLLSALRPPPSGGRNHLNLAAFRDSSLSTSAWVRWYARVLELLISSSQTIGSFLHDGSSREEAEQRVTCLLHGDLLREMESLVQLAEEMHRAPEPPRLVKNRLVGEVVRLVEEDMVAVERELGVRLREMEMRVDSMAFGDAVELVCLLRRLEDEYCEEKMRPSWRGGDEEEGKEGNWFRRLVVEMKEKAGKVVVEKEVEERRVRSGREKKSESARLEGARLALSWDRAVRFGSSRWVTR